MQENEKMAAWVAPELDPEELYQEGRYEDIVRWSEENAQLLVSLCRRGKQQELERSVRFGTVLMTYFAQSLQKLDEKTALFSAGKLAGCLEALDRLQFAADQERAAAERAKLLRTKHLDTIVLALETHGTMTQTELSEVLRLRSSTLSETLKKVRKTGLVQASRYGKYQIYSLTESGLQYGAMQRRRRRSMADTSGERTLPPRGDEGTKRQLDALIGELRESIDELGTKQRAEYVRRLQDGFGADGVLVRAGEPVYLCDEERRAITKFDVTETMRDSKNSCVSLYGAARERITFEQVGSILSEEAFQNENEEVRAW